MDKKDSDRCKDSGVKTDPVTGKWYWFIEVEGTEDTYRSFNTWSIQGEAEKDLKNYLGNSSWDK